MDNLPADSYEGETNIVTTGTGVKGQGDIVPSVQMFGQHYIVTRGNPYAIPAESYTIYDASYGTKYEGTDAAGQWSTNALDGFYELWDITATNATITAGPNDSNSLMRINLIPEENYFVF